MKKIFGTHSGAFHADDVFAIATLSLIHPNYEIIRTRDPEVWAKCDYLVDVGGFYDHDKKVYDHHFKNTPTYDDGLPMSSVGLIWDNYGVDVCGSKSVAERVCKRLIRQLDANDNGVTLTKRVEGAPDVREVSLSESIAMMNPIDTTKTDEVFKSEVERARQLLKAAISSAKHWIESRHELNKALDSAIAENRAYIEISENCKWSEHLLNSDNGESILYAIYPHGEKWYIRAVPTAPGEFTNRKDLPQSWAGLRDEEFSEVAGVSDGVFCHHALFICAANSYESIIKLVNKAIES